MLEGKSLVELRGIAQSLDIPDVFQKDKTQLLQAISLKHQALFPKPKVEIPQIAMSDDAMAVPDELSDLLAPFVEKGLRFTCTETSWEMRHGKKQDSGTMSMPMKTILRCAQKVME